MLDIDKLNVFIHVTNNLSFTDAAKQLHISQPTVSKNIRDLEREMGVQLFDRSGARPRLTSAGKTLLPLARKIIRQSIEVQELMSSMDEEFVGELRIACSTTVGKYILPQLAARLSNLHPEIHITILRCTPEHAVLNLLDGDADLGVISYETCGAGLDQNPTECLRVARMHQDVQGLEGRWNVLLMPSEDHPFPQPPRMNSFPQFTRVVISDPEDVAADDRDTDGL